MFQYLPLMQGKSLAMIFEKRSTRTRLSAETGRSEQWHSKTLYETAYIEKHCSALHLVISTQEKPKL